MKKIVIISDVWHPQVNGVMTWIEKTIELLEQRDFEVVVIHPGLFYTIPMPFYPEIRLALFSRNKIIEILKKEKPDYVHIATEGLLGFNACLVCKKLNIKFTTSYHTNLPQYVKVRLGMLFGATYQYLRWLHNSGENTMVCTDSLKEELESHGFKNIVLWSTAVDTDFFVKTKNGNSVNSFKKPVFFYLGRVAVEKDVEEFLKCSLPGTKLVIGDGPDRKRLEKKYGGNVTFVGYKKGKELVSLISECDVMVFPSRTDTFGLVIIESMSCGIPVAAHNVMGPKDIISDGIDGYLDEDLSRAAVRCLTLSSDDCRKKALKYSWDNSVKSFIENLVQN